GMEKLVDQILFVSHVARKQMRDEQFRDAVLFMQHARHQRLFDPGKRTVCHRGSRGYTQRLTCKAPLAEEFTGAQNGDDRFLTLFRCNREPHFAPLEVEHGIRRLSLPEDVAVRAVFCNRLADRDASEEGFPIDRKSTRLNSSHGSISY